MATRVLRLERNKVATLGDLTGRCVRILEGVAWITREGDPLDHLVRAGQSLVVGGSGTVVVQGLAPTRLEVEFGPCAAPTVPVRAGSRTG
jgi:2-keto-4-pentenoate hydratase